MEKLTSIIVDDELHGRENLKMLLETYCKEIEVLNTADSVLAAKDLVLKLQPDVVFLDINMPVLDGFDFLEYFEKRNFMVVFVSAHSDYGVKAVKTRVDDYLLKPVHIKELQQTVQKLLAIKNGKYASSSGTESKKILLPIAHGFELYNTDEIIRFEADDCYTKVFITGGKTLHISKTLKEFEVLVPSTDFFRIHKSHLINLKHIKEYSRIDGGFVTMINGNVIEVSRRKLHEFSEKVKKVMNLSIE